uniref:Uncharacterized protein n=1 Tax=Eptatretus burgeri TaxID=7764 RepID=A0A8C4WXG6_EPTBU
LVRVKFPLTVLLAFMTSNLLPKVTFFCPHFCKCDIQQRSVSCPCQYLTVIPKGIPRETRSLDLNKNWLRLLRREDFAEHPLIENLKLSDNFIRTIEPGVFEKLPFLRSLSLSGNHLWLLQNKALTDGLFHGLGYLRHLKVGTLSQLVNLVQLCIHHVSASVLSDYSFQGLLQLRVLEIDCWPFLRVLQPNSLQGLYLTSLTITNTRLAAIPSPALRKMLHLQFLNLSHNPLKIINTGAFSSLSNLQQLYLVRSQLSHIEHQAFQGLGMLTVLNISCNRLMFFDNQSFQTTDSLKILGVENNPLVCSCNLLWLDQLLHNLNSGHITKCYIFTGRGRHQFFELCCGWKLNWVSRLPTFVGVCKVSFMKRRRAITGTVNKSQTPAQSSGYSLAKETASVELIFCTEHGAQAQEDCTTCICESNN